MPGLCVSTCEAIVREFGSFGELLVLGLFAAITVWKTRQASKLKQETTVLKKQLSVNPPVQHIVLQSIPPMGPPPQMPSVPPLPVAPPPSSSTPSSSEEQQ